MKNRLKIREKDVDTTFCLCYDREALKKSAFAEIPPGKGPGQDLRLEAAFLNRNEMENLLEVKSYVNYDA